MWSRKTKRNELIFLLSLFFFGCVLYRTYIYKCDNIENIIIIFCFCCFRFYFGKELHAIEITKKNRGSTETTRQSEKKLIQEKKTEKNMSTILPAVLSTQPIEWSRFFYRRITDKNKMVSMFPWATWTQILQHFWHFIFAFASIECPPLAIIIGKGVSRKRCFHRIERLLWNQKSFTKRIQEQLNISINQLN